MEICSNMLFSRICFLLIIQFEITSYLKLIRVNNDCICCDFFLFLGFTFLIICVKTIVEESGVSIILLLLGLLSLYEAYHVYETGEIHDRFGRRYNLRVKNELEYMNSGIPADFVEPPSLEEVQQREDQNRLKEQEEESPKEQVEAE